MAVSKRLRYEIFRRDNHTCRYCGRSAPDVELEADHVVPRTLGGDDEPSNLVTSCADCNAGKSSVPADAEMVENVSQDALRWSGAMTKAAEIQRRQREELDEALMEYDWAWEGEWNPIEMMVKHEPGRGWHYGSDPDRFYDVVIIEYDSRSGEERSGKLFDDVEEAKKYVDSVSERAIPPRPKDWRKSAKSWIAAGLTSSDFVMIVRGVVEDRDYIPWDRKWAYTAGCCWGQIRERQAVAQALLNAEEQPASDTGEGR